MKLDALYWKIERLPTRPVLLRLLTAAALATWFLWHAWSGLFVFFHGDDMMNLYRAWNQPLSQLFTANLTPFSSEYRPLGAAFYRVLFSVAGFQPLPFRLIAYGLMLANIGIAYWFVRTLTNSREVAVLAALLCSFHNHFMALYQDGGTIYDVLCFTFFYASATCYILWRRSGGWWRLTAFAVLAVLALNSKEMAVALPAVLWLYELVNREREKAGWAWAVTVATTIAVAVSTWIKIGPGTLYAGNPGYATFGFDQWLITTQSWISQLLFLRQDTLPVAVAVTLLFAPLAVGLFTRKKELIFAGALIPLLPLPVNLIPLRDFFVMYVPILMWALFAAAGIVMLRDRFANALHPVATFALVAVVLQLAMLRDPFPGFEYVEPTQIANRALYNGLAQYCPSIPAGGRLLLAGDPFDVDNFDALFVARLFYRDTQVEIDRTKKGDSTDKAYACRLAYSGDRFLLQPH